MVDGLATAIIVVSLLVAGFGVLMAVLNRPPGPAHLVGLALVESVLLVQAVVAISKMFTGQRPDGMVTFVGYLLTAVLLCPLAAMIGWAERSRWGSVIVAGACFTVAILVVRLQQVWDG